MKNIQDTTIIRGKPIGYFEAAESPRTVLEYKSAPAPVQIFGLGGRAQFLTYKRGHIAMNLPKMKDEKNTKKRTLIRDVTVPYDFHTHRSVVMKPVYEGPTRISNSPLVDRIVCNGVEIRFGIYENNLVVESTRYSDGKKVNIVKTFNKDYNPEAILWREERKLLNRYMEKRNESLEKRAA